MPYGYTGALPNQIKNNSGVFSVADVTDLTAKGQAGGSLELIEEQTVSSVSAVDFTSIKESKYDVHFMQVNTTDISAITYFGIQFYESGVLETSSVYQEAFQSGLASGTFAEVKSTGRNQIIFTQSNIANTATSAYLYFYNLGNSSKYSFLTAQGTGETSSNAFNMYFGGGVLPQASTVDGIRVKDNFGNMTGTIKLYGVKQI
jgi:hypothetical protein